MSKQSKAVRLSSRKSQKAFSLVELLVVVAIIGVLSSILLPALAKAKGRAQGVYCLNNTKQLTVAWVLYSDDHEGRLPNNIDLELELASAMSSEGIGLTAPKRINWVEGFLDWELTPANTNAAALTASGIGPYTPGSATIYRCPSDYALSSVQQAAGWKSRVRSYSMNGMIGDPGMSSVGGTNRSNPDYLQFFNYASIPRPSDIFVFLDEHPDSINDGYFIPKKKRHKFDDEARWDDLPASYHDGAAGLAFADGHAEMHRWRRDSTKPSSRPHGAKDTLGKKLRNHDVQDFRWVFSTMSVERYSDYYHY